MKLEWTWSCSLDSTGSELSLTLWDLHIILGVCQLCCDVGGDGHMHRSHATWVLLLAPRVTSCVTLGN